MPLAVDPSPDLIRGSRRGDGQEIMAIVAPRPATCDKHGREDRDLQHQQRQPPAAEPPRLAQKSHTRRRRTAGAEGHRRPTSPTAALRKAGYGAVWRGSRLERRRHPRPRRRARADPRPLPGDPDPTTRAATSRRRSTGILVASIYPPNGNPSPARNSTTSSPGPTG